jgi:prophage maintenance system killer protein
VATEKGANRLNRIFSGGAQSLAEHVENPFERATAFFLFGSLQQFFFDGNKRTSRFMMNGLLMTEGIDAVSIPAARATEFNSRMVDFYITRTAAGRNESTAPPARRLSAEETRRSAGFENEPE